MKRKHIPLIVFILLYSFTNTSATEPTDNIGKFVDFPSQNLQFEWGAWGEDFRKRINPAFRYIGLWRRLTIRTKEHYVQNSTFLSYDTQLYYDFYDDVDIYSTPEDSYVYVRLHALGYAFPFFNDDKKMSERYETIQKFLTRKYGKPVFYKVGKNNYIRDKEIYTPRYWGRKLKRISVWRLPDNVEVHHYIDYYYYANKHHITFYSPKFKQLEAYWVESIDDII